ncbi:hypothetical protein [Flavobacterium chungangensis]|uniref:Uncharacterized protein n=1 Tax=Flavobacterium chungangensis TaxID=2708132 RepID=A0ABV8ZEU6_9FLAO
MFKLVYEMLKLNDFNGESEEIEIAKGKYKFPESAGELFSQLKRKMYPIVDDKENG